METTKKIAPPGYLLALMLILFPLGDGFTTIWPFQFAEERWRFGAVGSLGNLTMLPILGVFLAMAIAVALDHRRTRRVLGWISGIIAILLAATIIIFVLDYFQMRSQVRPQFRRVMDVASAGSLIKQLFSVMAMTLLAKAGLSGPKEARRGHAADATRTPLIPLTTDARS